MKTSFKDFRKDPVQVTEGFTNYSVSGSDTAADAMAAMCEEMEKSLSKSISEAGNEYNTPGFLNVAMIFHEYLLPGKFYNAPGAGKLKSIALKAYKALNRVQGDEFQGRDKILVKSLGAFISKAH